MLVIVFCTRNRAKGVFTLIYKLGLEKVLKHLKLYQRECAILYFILCKM